MPVAVGGFWRLNGKKVLVILAVVSLIAAGVFGQFAYTTDIEPYLPDVFPDAASFELVASQPVDDSYLYLATDEDGFALGYVSAADGKGYVGPMITTVAWSLDGVITNVQVAEHHETPQWYNRLFEQDFFDQYIGRSYSDPLMLDDDIDAASGATRSSTGISVGVVGGRQLLSEYMGDPYPTPEEPFTFGFEEIMLLVGIGMVIMFRTLPPLKKLSWSRYATLLFGFIVFGVWISSPLSLVNFVVWPVGFIPPWQTSIFLYILVFGIVGLALVFAKNFWCFWICPFAAVQEVMHVVGGGRVRPVTKRQQLLRNTRYFVLWLAVFMVLVTHKPAISVFEPWNTLFSFEGSPEQWILVVATLVVAIFIYDFWCHYLCPVGAILDIVLKIRMWFTGLFNKKAPPVIVRAE